MLLVAHKVCVEMFHKEVYVWKWYEHDQCTASTRLSNQPHYRNIGRLTSWQHYIISICSTDWIQVKYD